MLQMKTTKLQEMLARAIKGAGNNKLVPITNLLALELKDGQLIITTTDGSNYLYVRDKVEGDDFYVCVPIEKFPKLIARLTCEDVTLDLKESYLEVVGNGTYQIDFQLDEDTGEMVKFPNPTENIKLSENNKIGTLALTTVKTILNVVRPSLADTMKSPQYANYYVGDAITATDTFKISSLAVNIFAEPKLIAAETMDLLDTIIDDTIDIYGEDDKVVFLSEHGTVFGYTPGNIQTYAIGAIRNYLNKEYPSTCKVSKVELLQLLDRISLFVDYLDNDVINIAFEQDGLSISSSKSNGAEKIPYIECNNFAECSGQVLLERLRTQIKSQTGDAITMQFGDEKSIKMIDGNATLVVALGE